MNNTKQFSFGDTDSQRLDIGLETHWQKYLELPQACREYFRMVGRKARAIRSIPEGL